MAHMIIASWWVFQSIFFFKKKELENRLKQFYVNKHTVFGYIWAGPGYDPHRNQPDPIDCSTRVSRPRL